MQPAEPRPIPDATGGVLIRPFGVADLERVLVIEQASFSTPWHENTFRGLLRRTDTDLIAAEAGGRLLGYAVCWTVLDQAELGNLAVAAEARARGVGRRLVEVAMRRVWDRGARECFLEVRESNPVARALYRECGFEVVGRRRAYYTRPTEDALVMRLRLV